MTLQEQLALGNLVSNGLHVQLKVTHIHPVSNVPYEVKGRVVSVTGYPTNGMPRHVTLDSGLAINAENLDVEAFTVYGKRAVVEALNIFKGNHE